MSAIIFLAPGFEEIEAISVIDILRRADVEIKTVGVSDEYITGAHGITVKCDVREKDFKISDNIKAIILPGGMPGTLNLQQNKLVNNCIDFALEKKIYIAAICAAPMILGQLGILKSRKAVCYPGFEDMLFGVNVSDQKICVDGKFITAKGPGVATEFALKIVEILKGEIKSDIIRKDLLA